ncbi:MAG: glycosyltransferase [Pirellulales bacterium]|nr:glycosyltransferase [Pirellulales bacterium]
MILIGLIAAAILALMALVHAFLMGVQAWEHRRFARRRLARLDSCRPAGRAMVFIPCKGIDVGFEENLRGFFRQDHEDYELTFVVESPWDPACKVIARAMAEHPDRVSHLVIAGRAEDCGQKVHNLRVAIAKKLSSRIEYLAFADSDARPRPEWLRALVGRLGDESKGPVGAATGYRWLIPMRDTPANHAVYSINCNVATLLGSRRGYPIWGGSWAIRRATFEAIGLLDAWRGTLSDDLVATNVLRRHGLAVCYEPACMIGSPIDGTLRQHFRFLRRQYIISRFNLPNLWLGGMAGSLVFTAGWMAALAALGGAIAAGSWVALPAAGVCLALYAIGAARAKIRQDLVDVYLPDYRDQLRRASRFDVWAHPLAGFINTLAVLASCVGRRIRWRDVTYRLEAGGAVQIVARRWPVVGQAETPPRPEETVWPALSDELQRKVA